MGRIKLKIKRLETSDSILDTYAKRKSKILIQEAVSREEAQKTRVKEFEEGLKQLDAEINRAKELENTVHQLKAFRKHIEDKLKERASLHSPSKDPKNSRPHDALHKKKEALEKQITENKKVVTVEDREKIVSDIDAERAKIKPLEEKRKQIEKGAYLALKEALRKKFASGLDVERAKVKQLESNRKEIEKGASPTSKEGFRKKLASDEDVESAKAKQLEQNRKEEIMRNFVEPEKDQFANDAGQIMGLNSELPVSMEEATPFNMVKNDKMTIRIGEVDVPLCPQPSLLAAQAKKPAANP